MPTPETITRSYHPDPPEFSLTAYGVTLDTMGDDLDMVAHGHVSPRRLVAAANRARRENGLDPLSRRFYADLKRRVTHEYDFRLLDCDCPLEVFEEAGCEDDLHAPIDDEISWWIRWTGVTADTPGAFPITLGLWS